jgi:hypothetical protein
MYGWEYQQLGEDLANFKKIVFDTYSFICKYISGVSYNRLLETVTNKTGSKGVALLVIQFLLFHGYIYEHKDGWIKKT